MIVTAEPYFAVTQPSDAVVMENFVRPDTKGLIEQVNKVIEQRVLVLNVERQYAVKKPRHVVEIIFPHFFAAVAVSD